MTSDAPLAKSVVDRLTAGAHTPVVKGPSYRQRGRASVDAATDAHHAQ